MSDHTHRAGGVDDAIYRALIETSPDIIIVASADGTIQFINRVLPGYDIEKIPGTSLYDFVGEESAKTIRNAVAKAVTTGEVQEFLSESANADDSVTYYRTRLRAVDAPADSKAPQRVVLYVTEYTQEALAQRNLERTQRELEDAREQFVQAQKLESLGRLAGGVAHDFNNLLTTIISFTRFVMDELPQGDPRRDDLSEVMKAADSAARLTSKLLSFARRKPVEPTDFDLCDAVRNFDRLLRRAVGSDVELVVLEPERPVHVHFDIGQLEQLLMNLSVNARDAMPTGGQLTIQIGVERVPPGGVLAPGDYATISVTDSGMGIPADVVDRIFEPFFTTKGEKGTGLGLSTCYGVVRQAQGDIRVRSEPGKGTTMKVFIPRTTGGEGADASSAPPAAVGTKRSGYALVVEDQPAILRMVSRCMSRVGYDVLEARTAEEALALFGERSKEIRLMISDVVLPGLTGVELVRRVRADAPQLRVILMSGYTGDESPSGLEQDHRTTFLAKPFTADQLMSLAERFDADESRPPMPNKAD